MLARNIVALALALVVAGAAAGCGSGGGAPGDRDAVAEARPDGGDAAGADGGAAERADIAADRGLAADAADAAGLDADAGSNPVDAVDTAGPADARDAADAGGVADARDAADAGAAGDTGAAADTGAGPDVSTTPDAGAAVDAGGPACDADCWKSQVFGPASGWPKTVQRMVTTTTSDFQCVVVGNSTGCLAQNDPPCRSVAETRRTTLALTVAADGTVRIAAPYQDMCTADYVGGVIDQAGAPTGEPVPTSYLVPLATTTWYYAPRSIDRCRTDVNGVDARVEHHADTAVSATEIVVTQDCFTTLRDDTTGTPRLLHDTRHYVTRVSLAGP